MIFPQEAAQGSRKVVSLPRRHGHRLIRIIVPSGVRECDIIRLRGINGIPSDDREGDVF
jgi:hypothetical protein